MSSEQQGFVFSVVFIVVFSALLSSIPAGLYGPGLIPDMITPVNPNLIADFTDSIDFVRSNFTFPNYFYNLGGRSWVCMADDTYFFLWAKVLIGGILWLGGTDACEFIFNGEDRGESLTFAEIEADANDGTVRYSLAYVLNGNSAGGFVIYWNTTDYSDPSDAWLADGLYLLHGVGIENTANMNIVVLLVSLLLLQLPDVPLLVNVLIAVPIWAGIVYILWYIIKETIPFV